MVARVALEEEKLQHLNSQLQSKHEAYFDITRWD